MKYFDQFDKWLLSLSSLQSLGVIFLIVLALFAIILFFVWLFSPKPRGEKYLVFATVEEKSYNPSRRSSGSGVGITSGGQIGTVATSNSTPESFNVVFITDQKEVIVANDKNAYGQLIVGQKVRIRMQPYRLFGRQKASRYDSFETI